MSIDNENIEPVTELSLSLGYSNHRIERRRFMSNDSAGAGANAGSGIHMTFVATNPLSELVWSPLKGPSNVALLPVQSIAGRKFPSHNKNRIDAEDFLTLSTCPPFQMKGRDVASKDVTDSSPGSATACVMSVRGLGRKVEAGQVHGKRGDISSAKLDQPKTVDGQMEKTAENPVDKDRNAENSKPTLQRGFVLASEPHSVKLTKARSGKCIEKMESISENDLRKHIPAGATNKAVGLELSCDVKGSSRMVEETPETNKTVRAKGKEKALSDGDLNAMMPRDDDDSHESVESCNSARSFAAGKRRRNFDDDFVDESKGPKKQMHSSAPIGGQDSSFMNWISNMMKGFSQSAQDEAPMPLSVVPPDKGQENPDKRIVAFDKSQEQGPKFIGFQSIFQSLYCSKGEAQETRMLNSELQIGEGSNKTSDNSTPKACPGDNNSSLGKPVLRLKERVDESPSRNVENSAIQPKILVDQSASSDDNTKGQLTLMSKGKERTSSSSSLGKRKSKSHELVDSEPPFPGKTSYKFCHRNDPLGSFWITRFSLKNPGSSSYPDHPNQSSVSSPKPSAECLNVIPQPQSNVSAPMKSEDDPMLLNKLIPVLPFPVVKPSGPMASVFARRLDSLKHMNPPRVTNGMTCFFCGMNGHNIRDCSKVAEFELEELVRNLNTYSGAEELHCLCIRCFQQTHWAIACPKALSTKRLEFESHASFTRMQISTGNKENSTVQTDKDGTCEGGDLRTKALINWKVDETFPIKKHSAENTLKETQITPLSLSVTERNSDALKGLFDAVRGLRLSRGDILKWMNSHASVSHIEGFFLRLRLRKCEQGLGGTGYHAACIIGTQKENEQQDAKHSLLVKMGGMKCLVESQYVSNNDFLEDELMAWWSIISRNGDKIPSEEELRTKQLNDNYWGRGKMNDDGMMLFGKIVDIK